MKSTDGGFAYTCLIFEVSKDLKALQLPFGNFQKCYLHYKSSQLWDSPKTDSLYT